MGAPEHVNELVGDDAQPFVALGARRIDPDPPTRDLEVPGSLGITGGVDLEERHGEADTPRPRGAPRGDDLVRPVLQGCERDDDFR